MPEIGQLIRVGNSPVKLELATRIAGNSSAPRQALESLFKGVILGFQNEIGRVLDVSLRERVWNRVSETRLTSLKSGLISEFSERVLGTFNEEDAVRMLHEHKEKGVIRDPIFSRQIQAAIDLNRSAIADSVCERANAMVDDWVPEIFNALREEGVVFPEGYNPRLNLDFTTGNSGA